MREIKFRKWIESTPPRMIYWNEILSTWYENILDGAMQFTGLLDKNGKEIYEGDIVKRFMHYGDKTGKAVEWVGAGFWAIGERMEHNFDYEVIGNIYENPELINHP